ncbi:MAG: endonuclease III [Candidatus Colwellbacteria bacterium]|nr:endonuclease III [Candidatus Colwellbacteria bacterium]
MKRELTSTELKALKKWAHRISAALEKLFPRAKTVLKYSNNWELLVAVVLSAQCTDKKVNEVTEKLFRKYKTLADYLKANQEEFERDIRPTGFYHNKAKNILRAAKFVNENYGGKIPKTMEEMVAIPGLGRKSANVILGNAYGIVGGIAVDTHVGRLARVLGLTDENNPEKVEKDLMNLFPKDEWFQLTYRLIDYGRKYCSARPHNHAACPLANL